MIWEALAVIHDVKQVITGVSQPFKNQADVYSGGT